MLSLVLLALSGATVIRGQDLTTSFSPTPVSTTVPSASAAPGSPIPGQGMYPPVQILCNMGMNATYCPGPLLQDAELSMIFPDSKTFPDKPTVNTSDAAFAAFNALGSNLTIQQITTFVEQNFKGEGLELEQVPIEGFNPDPAILDNINDPIYKGFVKIVNSYWTLLIRQTNQSALCTTDCESSLIPLNNTIVVPGGRYREIYYWDSYWILAGLLKSELFDYATDLLNNFMDFIEVYGFIPNGGRKYYLNRSQPPVFIQMVDEYLQATNNVTILDRAIPLAENNRSINVQSPWSGNTLNVYHYDVHNTAPRPEGYVEDYTTVMGTMPALNSSGMADLYAELATGAESGWDYSSRWAKVPVINVSDNNPALRTLNIRAIIPVDLNSLLSGDRALLASFYDTYAASPDATNQTIKDMASDRSWYHKKCSKDIADAVLDLNWDSQKAWFYDFNTSSNTRSDVYHAGGTFALWQNITPPELWNNEDLGLKIVSGSRYLLGKYAGIPSVATLLYTGLNWDFPNSWPNHAHSYIKAFEFLGRMFPSAQVLDNITLPFSGVNQGQFNLNESQLQPQPSSAIGNTSLQLAEAQGKPWPLALSIEYANRYMAGAFCSWYSTGGEISGLLTQLSLADLNATGTYQNTTGVMFEKFNITDLDAAGGGGEYTVQIGFGWTNGVVLWIGGEYGQYLPQPTCPMIPIVENGSGGGNMTSSGNGTMNGTSAMYVNTGARFSGYRIPRT